MDNVVRILEDILYLQRQRYPNEALLLDIRNCRKQISIIEFGLDPQGRARQLMTAASVAAYEKNLADLNDELKELLGKLDKQ
jgi:hypothetical protein